MRPARLGEQKLVAEVVPANDAVLISEDALVLKVSEDGKAILCDCSRSSSVDLPIDGCLWVPRSVLHASSSGLLLPGQRGRLVVQRWYAQKKNLH